jgi:hypothetical protein
MLHRRNGRVLELGLHSCLTVAIGIIPPEPMTSRLIRRTSAAPLARVTLNLIGIATELIERG